MFNGDCLRWKCKKLFTDPDNGIDGIAFIGLTNYLKIETSVMLIVSCRISHKDTEATEFFLYVLSRLVGNSVTP